MSCKADRRGTKGAFGGKHNKRNPVIQPDYSTMDPKFMNRKMREKHTNQ